MPRTTYVLLAALPLLLFAAFSNGCGGGDKQVLIGATTSVQGTGLLDALLTAFQNQTGYSAKPVVAGSGQVLKQASQGALDVVLTHAPPTEQKYMDSGDLIGHRLVMENSFLLVGPPSDPAGVKGAPTLEEAFRRIAAVRALFITRSDGSGTNVRELAVWQKTGVDTSGQSWYKESGVGQTQSLLLTSDKAAYTLVDSATFAVLQKRVSLVQYVLDPETKNRYSVSLVNPARHSGVNQAGARAFADFLLSPTGQDVIRSFGADKYGSPLFVAAGGR